MKKQLGRKLVAVMFTDMVGYTALMQRDEELAIRKRVFHKHVIEEQHQKYGGELIQYFGDGTLSIFKNSVDAVNCAIDIQKSLIKPLEIPLRIGIHVGNVIVEEDGILGDAVNIASRIESFASPGSVLISDAVYDQLINQTNLSFVQLGKFKLKNVARPFDIYAISCEGLNVPIEDLLQGKGEKVVAFKSIVPTPATPIIGREKEINDVLSLLGKHKLVTITGTGGIGKTRLALEICQRLEKDYKDGIAFVSMINLTEAKEVIPALAAALNIKEAEGKNFIDGISSLIADKKALLVLDNLEQVISAAHEIAKLIGCCPNSKILCTSRTPLKIKAEIEYPLHPLEVPQKAESINLLNNPAARLFVERAQRVKYDFELNERNAAAILEICRKVDGLPLAIELAAARIKILSPDQLLFRLSRSLDLLSTREKDVPERHQTVRATIDWSYNLLPEPSRLLFQRLGVFTGGFTLEAVENVCYENELRAYSAIDELESLVDESLVRTDGDKSRFSLLQTINEYAIEKLTKASELEVYRKKHADYFYAYAKKINEGIHGENQLERVNQAVHEDANVEAALDYLLEAAKNGDVDSGEMGLAILGELAIYWHIRGKHISGKNYIESFLEFTQKANPGIGKCKAYFHLHVATFSLGRMEESKSAAIQHHQLAVSLGDALEIAKSYFSMGWGHFGSDPEAALKYNEKGISLLKELKHDSWLGFSLWQNGVMELARGRLDPAFNSYSASLEMFDKIKNYEGKGCAQSGLAMVHYLKGNAERAIEEYQEALTSFAAIGDRLEEARVLSEMSWIYLAKNNTAISRKYIMESIQAYQEVCSNRGIGLSLNALAAIEAVEGQPINAVQITSAAEKLAEEEGVVIEFGINNHGMKYIERAKDHLTTTQIEEAQRLGKSLSLGTILKMNEYEMIGS